MRDSNIVEVERHELESLALILSISPEYFSKKIDFIIEDYAEIFDHSQLAAQLMLYFSYKDPK